METMPEDWMSEESQGADDILRRLKNRRLNPSKWSPQADDNLRSFETIAVGEKISIRVSFGQRPHSFAATLTRADADKFSISLNDYDESCIAQGLTYAPDYRTGDVNRYLPKTPSVRTGDVRLLLPEEFAGRWIEAPVTFDGPDVIGSRTQFSLQEDQYNVLDQPVDEFPPLLAVPSLPNLDALNADWHYVEVMFTTTDRKYHAWLAPSGGNGNTIALLYILESENIGLRSVLFDSDIFRMVLTLVPPGYQGPRLLSGSLKAKWRIDIDDDLVRCTFVDIHTEGFPGVQGRAFEPISNFGARL